MCGERRAGGSVCNYHHHDQAAARRPHLHGPILSALFRPSEAISTDWRGIIMARHEVARLRLTQASSRTAPEKNGLPVSYCCRKGSGRLTCICKGFSGRLQIATFCSKWAIFIRLSVTGKQLGASQRADVTPRRSSHPPPSRKRKKRMGLGEILNLLGGIMCRYRRAEMSRTDSSRHFK